MAAPHGDGRLPQQQQYIPQIHPSASAEMGSLGRDYLGVRDAGHLRERSADASTLNPDNSEAYDMGSLQREDSRSPLRAPPGPGDSYPLPATAYPPASAQPASTPSGPGRVHYPPSPYMARTEPGYTTIPLHDDGRSPSGQGTAPGSTYSPSASGRNTPVGVKKKGFGSFLPMHHGSHSGSATPSVHNGSGEKPNRPKSSRTPSWDMLGLSGDSRAEWEEYNPAQASVENLRFAEGDVGTNRLSRLYYWALNSSIAVRWALYIVPILAIIWVPGIVNVTAAPNAKVWSVKLLFWSIWLSVLWGGFWAAKAVFMMIPTVFRNTVGTIIPGMKQYSDVVANLGKYAKLIVWTVAMWISFTPLIINNYTGDQSANSRSDLTTFSSILFGLFLCSIVLSVEKFCIQLIALQFHRDSYEDRLKEQKFQLKCITMLYINSHDIPGRSDTLTDAQSSKTKGSQIPKMAIRRALRGLKTVAQTTTTALGNIASEMAGQSVLQTNSPANKVTAAISSANKSKALARRLFYSFRQGGADHLTIADIAQCFPDLETAQAAFQVFDVHGNGDATRDEIELSILQIHRDRLSLEASMRDLDGAVRRLDDICMVLVVAIAVLILAAMVTTKLTTLVTSASTFILSLSWLIGSTMQEILLACIFLFVKHPYDVGDRVDIDGQSYTVAKMQLLSTSFKRVDGKFVWIGHNVLTAKVIENVRRSGPTSETFSFEVDFSTSFEVLQVLRAKMLAFVKENSRDYLPIFDVIVDDMPAQGKMVLKADIRYKSNWQQGALKVQRRNKWICALKMTLADLKIWGPAGAGNPSPDPADPTRYTLIPYEQAVPAPASTPQPKPDTPPPTFHAATAASLTDRREIVNDPSQDIFNEDHDDDGYMTSAPSRVGTPGISTALAPPPTIHTAQTQALRQRTGPQGEGTEVISAPVNRRL